jgi:hypothetical protein
VGSEGVTQAPALIGAKQFLIEGEAGEPADFRFHRELRANMVVPARLPSAKPVKSLR